ncbi:MAG: nucleotidyltransferase domain-containing protein [Nanoarchaeota archaeon]|nr:nucleotidyltransferase domain-containing protein [Nanoarchaeota archaeon]MBU4038023.1 nucleotidyltransferase domain-containing protein [Pseudomonadota bacterium]MBU4124243.1 nucleotidyltransferase domain-containing protein [Nanoarchaeota archaeon]
MSDQQIKKELIIIAKDIANKLRRLPEIKAIAIYGGVAEGYADNYSDIDIICYCTKTPSIRKRKEVLGVIDIRQLPGHPDTDEFQYKNKYPNIFYCEYVPWLGRLIEDACRSRKLHDSFLISHLLNTVSLYDPNKLLTGWKSKLQPILKTHLSSIKEGSFSKLKHELLQIDISIKRKNMIHINQEISKMIDLFLIALYALNNQPFMSSKWSKERIKVFKMKPKNCVKHLEQISLLGNNTKDLNKKLKLLKSLIKDTDPLITR